MKENKNFIKLTQRKGISLIVLIVTIIVIIILAAVVILTITKNNPIENAKEATFKEDVRSFQDDLALTVSKQYTDNQGQRNEKISSSGEEVKKYIPSFTDKYVGKFIIGNDKLMRTDKLTKEEIKWAEELNVPIAFDKDEWNKNATDETCFKWGSDTLGEDGYDVIIGYNKDLANYPKVRVPARCKRIICDSTYYDNDSIDYNDIDRYFGRTYLNNIQKIEIPETVVEIGPYAFSGVYGNSLKSVLEIVIPNSVTSIGYSAFSGCSSLENITIPDSVTSISYDAFYGTPWYNNLPDGEIYLGKVLYKYNGQMPANTSITVKEGTTIIGNMSFENYSNLTNVTIPNSVTSIGSAAFSGCSSLANITIPKSVKSIGYLAFSGCSTLTNITFNGTTNEWNNIKKEDTPWGTSFWSDSYVQTITCTNGVITL